MNILVFIIILAILVLVHEFGHFLAAKKQGILVEEFGFGFPPRIFGFKRGETLYSINLLPIGGFVKLYGEEYHEEKVDVDPALKNRAFVSKAPWRRALVVVAGVIGNFLLAWVLVSYLFTQGVPTPTHNVAIDQIQPGSPAQVVGLKVGDQILKIIETTPTRREVTLTDTDQFIKFSKVHAQKNIPLTLVVKRTTGATQTVVVTPRRDPPAGQGPLGIVITSFMVKKYTWFQAPFYGLIHAFEITYRILSELLKTLFQLATFKQPHVDVSGPIGIANYTSQVIKFGNNAVLELMALLSLNLAVVNILPFPALDGGRLVFVVYEWITKRRVNKKIEQYVNMTGMIALLTLAAVISINDILKLMK